MDIRVQLPEFFPSEYFNPLQTRETKICTHPNHNPILCVYVPPGQVSRYTCPGCGKVTEICGTSINV